MSAPNPEAFIGKYFKDVVYQKYYFVHDKEWEVCKEKGSKIMNSEQSKILYFKECDIFFNPTGQDNALTMNYFLSGLNIGIYKFLNITTL